MARLREEKMTSERKPLCALVICSDGFTMSVQASEGAYSTPRLNTGPYTHVEVGFPSQEEPLLMPYVEDKSMPTKTVYPFVPSQVVTLVVAKHGGMIDGELPEGVPRLMSQQAEHSKF